MGGWNERRVSELAADQRLLVSAPQLRALGVDRGATARAIARGRLHRYAFGVYAVIPPPELPRLAPEQAAILACGPGTVISHRSAAALWGMVDPIDGPVSVTTPGGGVRGRRQPGIDLHRSATLARADTRRHQRLPVTAPARALIDFAASASSREIELALDRALVRRLTSRTAVRDAIKRCPKRAGVPFVRDLLDPSRPTSAADSPGSERLLMLIRGAGLPEPQVDEPLGDPHSSVALDRYRPDMMWRRFGVVVEYDGREYHSGRRAIAYDRRRDKEMIRAGWTVLRFRSEDLDERSGWVLVRVAAALTRGGWAA